MVSIYRLFFLARLPVLLAGWFSVDAQQVNSDVSYERLVSRADLTYTSPVVKSEEGIPIGNGTMGSLIWTTPTALHFQINRVDIFANNASTNNFYERHTDYCGGAGYVDIDFSAGEDVFASPQFRQHLSCYDGKVISDGNGVRTKAIAWMQDDVMAIEVEDNRSNPTPIFIHLRALRSALSRRGNHIAESDVQVDSKRIILKQRFSEDSYFCNSSVGIAIAGRNGKAIIANETEGKIVVPAGNGKFIVFIASDASFKQGEDLAFKTTEKLREAMEQGFDKLARFNEQWWRDFWRKSYVHLHSDDGVADLVEKNYTYYLYVMASSSRGKYPPKFNGMLWSTGGDVRKWGSLYW
ncbi:MAG TPA: DUF5703 domain-containing protein, partial [Cyclobacteriaceae bacterium]|nr:DUF5703 domain-containing protein [Cyclobacteriaceae bacterium]